MIHNKFTKNQGTYEYTIASAETINTCTMSPLTVHVKHAAKVYDVQLDPDQPASVFKNAVYQLTGVPLDRMKVMIKGGILKVGRRPT